MNKYLEIRQSLIVEKKLNDHKGYITLTKVMT